MHYQNLRLCWLSASLCKCLLWLFIIVPSSLFAQPATEFDPLEFDPTSNLKVVQTDLKSAKFPVVDVHTHFGFKLRGDRAALEEYVRAMERNNIIVSISFDAKLGSEEDHLKFIGEGYENQLAAFVHLDFIGKGQPKNPKTWASNQPNFVHNCVEQLAAAKAKGILGLKFFKSFGLTNRNADGSLMKIDDPRWNPIWKTCADLKLPIIMHVGDPSAFFQPIDANNERLEELRRHPDWSFYGNQFPERDELLAARNRVIERHPNTTFIGAHIANNSEDLSAVGLWLDKYPNLVVEIASRINELGRQPYTARKFFLKYQDRIMFGTDGPWPELRLSYYWRFLETYDEYIPYSEKSPPPQGLWRIYGIGLPDEVLKKVYSENALRIIPGLQKKFDAAQSAERPQLQIYNGTDQPCEVFWLKNKTERTLDKTVPPGKSEIITTTIGQQFAVVGGEPKREVMVTSRVPVQAYRFPGPDTSELNSPHPNGKILPVDETMGVPDYYTKIIFANGYPIVGSAAVSDYALLEAEFLVRTMLAQRPDVLTAMKRSGSRLCVMAHNEFTTDLPEFRRLKKNSPVRGLDGQAYWDARARGLGGSRTDPYCSCAEENLLAFDGDPYSTENILIHEFAHSIHLRGMVNVDPTFEPRLTAAYQSALQEGLWKGKYASVTVAEYFAEGVQSWFDNNRENDLDHNHVNTRAELKEYDPRLAALCEEVFRTTKLSYTKPATRLRDHLQGYDPTTTPKFVWPEHLKKAQQLIRSAAVKRSEKDCP